MSPFCKVERLGKHIKLKYFQKVRFCGAQIPKFERKSFKNEFGEIWRNLEKLGDLGPIDNHFLKIFQIYMFTLSFFPKWAHSYFHHD